MITKPLRRHSFTEEVAGNGFALAVTVSFDPETGGPCEVFFTQRGKSGTDLDNCLYDIGVAASKIIQEYDRSREEVLTLREEVLTLREEVLTLREAYLCINCDELFKGGDEPPFDGIHKCDACRQEDASK
jgi:hypothetical protein